MKENIALIIPYFGKLPIWFNAFLKSCSTNPSISWIIFSDLKYQGDIPQNVIFKHLNKAEFTQLAKEKTGICNELSDPYKLCDFKPMYGHIFEDYLSCYSYWGHCDMDIIWGNIQTFLTRINFSLYDVISTRKNAISGHLTLYKNKSEVNKFYQTVPNFHKAFTSAHCQGFDEGYFSFHLFSEVEKGNSKFKVFWPDRNCVDRLELQTHPNGWYWEAGEIKNILGQTGTYIHLIDWKKTMWNIDGIQNTSKFIINQHGIWLNVPFEIRLKAFFQSGIWFRAKLQIYYLKSLIKFKILRRSKPPEEANVLKEYQVLR